MTKSITGSWLVSAIVVGAALGVVFGGLVWWLAGAIIIGFVAEMVRFKSRQ